MVGLACVHVPLPNAYVHVPFLVTAWVGLEQNSAAALTSERKCLNWESKKEIILIGFVMWSFHWECIGCKVMTGRLCA